MASRTYGALKLSFLEGEGVTSFLVNCPSPLCGAGVGGLSCHGLSMEDMVWESRTAGSCRPVGPNKLHFLNRTPPVLALRSC